jgi:hypothetical protein
MKGWPEARHYLLSPKVAFGTGMLALRLTLAEDEVFESKASLAAILGSGTWCHSQCAHGQTALPLTQTCHAEHSRQVALDQLRSWRRRGDELCCKV